MTRILVVLTLLFAVAACGDDTSQEADDELIGMVEAYARTQIEGDAEAMADARSTGCAVVDTDLDAEPAEAEGDGGEPPRVSDVEADVDGDEATVSYRLDSGEEVEGERWIREDGEWKWNNC